MSACSSRSTLTFPHAFCLSGYTEEFPAGDYEVLVEGDVVKGPGFSAYTRTATYLTVPRKGGKTGRSELCVTTEIDLQRALGQDGAQRWSETGSVAATPCA